jgi:hypothetical protein
MDRALSASVTVQHILLEALQDTRTLSLHPASHCFPTMSLYQLTPFQVGQVHAHMHHQLTALKISRIIFKGDGKSRFSESAIKTCMEHLRSDPAWRGHRQEGSAAPRKTTKRQDKQIEDAIYKYRGEFKVTVAWLKKRYMWARALGNTAVEERLGDAELAYLRRRRKFKVGSAYINERLEYCAGVKRKHQASLDRWAYTDGTVFYLDRTAEENEQTQRAALGCMVWRRTDGTDALYADCVGPSAYKKAQGHPIRVWGMLANGKLRIEILDEGDVMNKELYSDLVDEKFPEWLDGCEHLVQDFEPCLRSQEALEAFQRVGVELVPDYPRSSQDFNAIENAWDLLRRRLDTTLPRVQERRSSFIVRLREAVRFVNRYRKNRLEELSRNQKVRCQECEDLDGGRTSW